MDTVVTIYLGVHVEFSEVRGGLFRPKRVEDGISLEELLACLAVEYVVPR